MFEISPSDMHKFSSVHRAFESIFNSSYSTELVPNEARHTEPVIGSLARGILAGGLSN